jgi:hypothetical protein
MWHVWGRKVVYTGYMEGKPEGKHPLGKTKRRKKDNIKIDLEEVGLGEYGLTDMTQDRDRRWTLVIESYESSCFITCGEYLGWLRP